MITTTTGNIDGRNVTAYLGIITGEAILGAHIFRDFAAGVRDVIGGRSVEYEEEFAKARKLAMEQIESRASGLGADAILGVKLDYEVVGSTGGMMMVTACGTAVKLEGVPARPTAAPRALAPGRSSQQSGGRQVFEIGEPGT